MMKNKKTLLISFLIFFFLLAVYFLLKIPFVYTLFKVIIYSFLFTYTLKPIYTYMISKGAKKGLSALILVLILFVICIALSSILIPKFVWEVLSLKENFGVIISYINDILGNIKLLQNNHLFKNLIRKIVTLGSETAESIVFGIMSLSQNFGTYLIMPVLIYYFLVDGEWFLDKILFFINCEKRRFIKKMVSHIDCILSKYILSQIILSIITGILTFIILHFLNVKGALILSVFNGILNIIPFFGPVIGAIPAIAIASFSSLSQGFWVAFWIIVMQQIEGNCISPKIVGELVNIHPVVVVLLLVVGGEIGGFIGMLMAIPIGVIVKVVFEDINYYFY